MLSPRLRTVVALTVLLAGCGGSSGVALPTEGPRLGVDAPRQATTSDSRTFDLHAVDTGLDRLDSYQLSFWFAFQGVDQQEQPIERSFSLDQEVASAAGQTHTKVDGVGGFVGTGEAPASWQPSGTDSVEMYQSNGISYLYVTDGQGRHRCSAIPGNANQLNPATAFKPSRFVGGLSKAQLIKPNDTVNGVAADEYVFDQPALDFGAFQAAEGKLWIARDGGYVVRYEGRAVGYDIFAGIHASGAFAWEYNLRNPGKATPVALPKECRVVGAAE